ncbi:hypothetical protein V6N13_086975 [Hibiscus sabdariffa]|uniref:Uncharacterized protein n=1 Tax=Hibiscus sabdariffa TaxID=183260 RepID=A0ABR2FUT7_9ROSI
MRNRSIVTHCNGLLFKQHCYSRRACLKKHVGSNAFSIILLAVESKVKSTVSGSTIKDKGWRTGGRRRFCLFVFFRFRCPGPTHIPCQLGKYVYKMDNVYLLCSSCRW